MPDRKDPVPAEASIGRYFLSGGMLQVLAANAVAIAIAVRLDTHLVDLLRLCVLERLIVVFWHMARSLRVLDGEDLSDELASTFFAGMIGMGAMGATGEAVGGDPFQVLVLPGVVLAFIHGVQVFFFRSGLKDERGLVLAIGSGMALQMVCIIALQFSVAGVVWLAGSPHAGLILFALVKAVLDAIACAFGEQEIALRRGATVDPRDPDQGGTL